MVKRSYLVNLLQTCRRQGRRAMELAHPKTSVDRMLARWMGVSVAVLLLTVVFMLSGVLEELENRQIAILGGHPFYMPAEEMQVNLMGPVGTFCLCAVVTLYLSAVMLREHRYGRRTQVAFLAAVALALPGLMSVFWGGVLNMAAPVFCVVALWCFAVPFAIAARLTRAVLAIHRQNDANSPS